MAKWLLLLLANMIDTPHQNSLVNFLLLNFFMINNPFKYLTFFIQDS